MVGLGYSSELFSLAIALLIYINPYKTPSLLDSSQDKADHYIVNYATHKVFISFNSGVLYSLCGRSTETQDHSSHGKNNSHNSGHAKLYLLVILLSGDVHPCPGPQTARKPKDPCGICSKGVRSNSKAILCDSCSKWIHIKCAKFPVDQYNNLVKSQEPFSYVCDLCLETNLPFGSIDDDVLGDLFAGSTRADMNLETGPGQFECFRQKGLHFLHLNVRSILPKMSEVRYLAKESTAAVLGFSETWVDDTVTDSEMNIDGYTLYRKDRCRNGGGVCCYVRNDLSSTRRKDMESNNLETIWIQISLPKTKPILVGTGYRPPKQSDFFDHLEDCLLNCDRLGDSECYFLGDMNVNVLPGVRNKGGLFKSLSEWQSMFDFFQLITEPTRLSGNSTSLLDHVFVSHTERVAHSGVVDIGISDHSLVFCTRKIVRGFNKGHKTIQIRSLKNYSNDNLVNEINSTDWTELYNCTDVNSALTFFNNTFVSILDRVAPIKQIRIKQNSEPWITSEIIEKIRDRDNLLFTFRKHKKSDIYSNFCKLRNEVQNLVKSAKRDYISSQIDLNKNKPKQLWNTLKQLGYSHKIKQNVNIGVTIDNEVVSDGLLVANAFNKFYTTVADDLVKQLPASENKYNKSFVENFYKDRGVIPNSFSLHVVSQKDITNYVKILNPKKSTGLDGISSRFLRDASGAISSQLQYVMNMSINSSQVPDLLKSAKVIPIYKKESKTEVTNYRPVSILCSLSKILERIVCDQVEDYLVKNSILYEFQSGFRSKYSTATCLTYLHDFVRKEISLGRYVGMVMIDLRKAFDTVNHTILCDKLKAVGFDSSTVSWFQSYLQNRTQLVNVNGVSSDVMKISCGVPQGSILGPLLFNLYVNDMCSSVDCKLILYADDSVLLVSHKDFEVVESTLSNNLQNLSVWLLDNKLSLHLGKTESMLFGSRKKLKSHKSLNINCNNVNISCASEVKYLGTYLNQNMDGNSTVRKIVSKCNSRLKFMYRQAKFLSQDAKRTLCNALIMCHFDYCSSSWYNSLDSKLKHKLQVCQNKVVRFVLNLGNRHHIGPEELCELNWLDTHHRAMQLQMNHVYNIFHDNSPNYLKCNFLKISNCHSYNTRSRQYNFFVPQINSVSRKTFYYNSIIQWNNLPNGIKSSNTTLAFKQSLKEYLVAEMNRLESEVFYYYL